MTFPNVDSDAQPSLVGVRVESCDDLHRGTVRYHGPIPAGGGALWLGVEWDDPRRGKHSGNGLFSVKVPGSASFVRVPKGPSPRMRLPQTVMAAVREKYLSSFDRETPAERETDRSSGLHARRPGEDVTVEMVGWNKTRKMQSKLSQIKILGLAGMQVGHVNEAVIYFSGVPKETVDADQAPGAIREALSVVEDIDLSRNLLSTWQEVAVIVGQLDSLESLRLNNNRLQILQDLSPLTGVFNKISILALATTFIAWNDIETLAEFFPNLKALHFGFNNLTSVATKKEDAPLFPALESLHLEDNSLISWKEMVHFAQMHSPNLRWLNVSNNNFTEIDSVSDANPAQMANLAVLNISGNKISEFTSLHALNSFPSLVEIRVKGNPFFALQPPTKLSGFDAVNSKAVASVNSHISQSDELISRLSKATRINGAEVTPRDRLDAEMYYLVRVATWIQALRASATRTDSTVSSQTQDSIDTQIDALIARFHPAYPYLVRKYGGAPTIAPASATSNALKDRLLLLAFCLVDENTHTVKKRVEKKVPTTMTLRALRALVGRVLGVAGSPGFRMSGVCDEGMRTFDLDEEMKDVGFFGFSPGDEVHVFVEN